MTEAKFTDEEIENFISEVFKARKDGPASVLLWKKLAPGRLSREAIKAASALGGRALYHINRLLDPERSEVENEFASALVRTGPLVLDEIENADYEGAEHIHNTLNSEGSDTRMWWTLSPYLFRFLNEKLGEKESIRELLNWAKQGKTVEDEGDDYYRLNLEGLRIYNQTGSDSTFTLGENPQGYSHEFARKEAERLASEVFLR